MDARCCAKRLYSAIMRRRPIAQFFLPATEQEHEVATERMEDKRVPRPTARRAQHKSTGSSNGGREGKVIPERRMAVAEASRNAEQKDYRHGRMGIEEANRLTLM